MLDVSTKVVPLKWSISIHARCFQKVVPLKWVISIHARCFHKSGTIKSGTVPLKWSVSIHIRHCHISKVVPLKKFRFPSILDIATKVVPLKMASFHPYYLLPWKWCSVCTAVSLEPSFVLHHFLKFAHLSLYFMLGLACTA